MRIFSCRRNELDVDSHELMHSHYYQHLEKWFTWIFWIVNLQFWYEAITLVNVEIFAVQLFLKGSRRDNRVPVENKAFILSNYKYLVQHLFALKIAPILFSRKRRKQCKQTLQFNNSWKCAYLIESINFSLDVLIPSFKYIKNWTIVLFRVTGGHMGQKYSNQHANWWILFIYFSRYFLKMAKEWLKLHFGEIINHWKAFANLVYAHGYLEEFNNQESCFFLIIKSLEVGNIKFKYVSDLILIIISALTL